MKKDEIINLSLQLFLEKGYEKTTITEIMKQAKLSKGGMYHYFSSKEDIFNAAVNKALSEEENLFKLAVNKCNSLEEKLALLFLNTSSASNYLKDFSFFIQQERESLIFYRLRELFKENGNRNLKKFLIEGKKSKKFDFDGEFIDEISKTVYSCGEDIAFRALDETDKKSFFQKEVVAFLYLELSSQVQRFIEKDFMRGFPT